jgi:hypothetical protein
LSYLRFTPPEYRAVASACGRFRLVDHDLPTFHLLLVAALGPLPGLAGRIAGLRGRRLEILYLHFRERQRPAAAGRHDLTFEELHLLAVACDTAPFRVRFARPFQSVLVELFEGARPELARKLAALSGRHFNRLYNRALGRGWWDC